MHHIIDDVNGLQLFLLGRRLMKLGEDSIHLAGYTQLPTSVRSVLVDIFEHPDTSIGEIAARTGFPQSHVSAAVARLRDGGALETAIDPADRRRTLVRPHPEAQRRAAQLTLPSIDHALAAALGTDDPQTVAAVAAALETVAQHLAPDTLHRARPAPTGHESAPPK
jgi:DNA-binding MarR family transcriptional regulator